jgi:hypothetical protein
MATAACNVEPAFTPIPVSPANLRSALPEVERRGESMVRDDEGHAQIITSSTQVNLPPELPRTEQLTTSVGNLGWQCSSQDHSRPCDLNGRALHPRVLVQTGSYLAPQWDSIGLTTLGVVVVGGVIGGEVYCFANCGTGGKTALVVVDVVSLALGTVVVIAFVAAIDHGMR